MIQRKNIFGWLLLTMLLCSVGAKADNVTFDSSSDGKAYLSATADMAATATSLTVTAGNSFYVILANWSAAATIQDIGAVTATVYVDGGSAQARRRTSSPDVVSVIQGEAAETASADNGYNIYNIYKVTLPSELSTLTSFTVEVRVTLQDKIDLSTSATSISFSNETLTYNGSAKHPATITVTNSSTPLTADQHYTYSWPESTDAGNYTITVQGKAGSHYKNSKTATYSISPKAVTITANNGSKTYNGSALTESGFTKSDLEEGDEHTFTVAMTGASTITNVGTQDNVIATVDGVAVTTGTATAVGNYLVTTAGGTLTVNPKAVTITADDKSKTYDGSALTESGFTASALESGDLHTFTVAMTAASTITNVGTQDNVIATVDGVAVTTGTATAVGNYTVTTVNGTLTVNPKVVTITADDDSKTYDGSALTKGTFTATALETGDTHTFTVVMTATSTITNVGTQANVITTVDGVAVTTGTATAVGNYTVTTVDGTLTVNRKAVTITAQNGSKTYDGSALTQPEFTASALESGDTHTFTVVMTAASTITNVGTQDNEIATVDGVAVTTGTATAVGNYTVTTANGTLTVNPKAVTITADDGSKTYDGTALTESGFTASALEEGDTHTFTVAMTTASTITDYGTQPNVVATVDEVAVTTGVETVVGNYLVTTVDGTLTVNRKAVTITANNHTKTYDGTALTESGFTASALEEGDTHTFTVAMTTGSTITNASTQANVIATVDGEAMTTGEEKAVGNYMVTTVDGLLTINPKTLTTDMVTPATLPEGIWTGSAQSWPTITVADGTIMTTSDYNIKWIVKSDANKTPLGTTFTDRNTYQAIITGQGNYTGEVTRDFSVGAMSISGLTVGLSSTTAVFAWDGTNNTAKDQTPTVTITGLTDTDFDVAWQKQDGTAWNATTAVDVVGTYKAVVTGKGNYKDSAESGEFTITAKPLSDADIEVMAIAGTTYTGAKQDPTSQVTVKIKEGSDYIYTLTSADIESVSWDDSGLTNAKTYTATITGKGNFQGTTTATYTIAPKALANDMFTLSATSATWTGSAQTFPTFTASDDEGNLTNNDYTYQWVVQGETTALTNYVDRGVYELQLTGQGNYTGSAVKTFTVGTQNIEGASITFTPSSATFKEDANHTAIDQTPALTVTKDGNDLTEGTHYNLKWQKYDSSSWVDLTATETVALPGAYRVVITGIGDFASQATSQSFEVAQYTLTDANVTVAEAGVSTLTYDGTEHQPVLVVKVTHDATEVTLRKDIDYVITAPDDFDPADTYKAAGAYSFTITGAGNYAGEGSATFTIDPLNYDLAFSGTGKWATFYNDEQVRLKRGDIASGLTAYIVTGVSATSVTAEEISGDVIPAKMPVLLNRGTSTATSFACEIIGDDMMNMTPSISNFVGVGTDTSISRGNYILVGDVFVRSNAGTLPANRCYLTILGSSGARSIAVDNGAGTTAIETMESEGESESADQWYSLDGRRIDKPLQKGIYIKNNKKVVIK